MAIYSLHVATVGKSTHAPGTAGAHVRYIAREDAATHVEAAHMPDDPQAARTWMDGYERDARKNARLMTKVRIALPRELTREQNAALVRDFIAGLTGGRIPSFAVIHDRGKDRFNPHAHIVLIDRDIETGKRALRLTDSPKDRVKAGLPENGVVWIRERWERDANRALEQAGHAARIDRRSLAAQGIDREAQIHIGPRAQHIDTQVQRPQSRPVPDPTPRHPDRVIDYPMIDAGRTRRERNAEIIDLNLERAARSPDFEARVQAQFEREQRAKDRVLEARLVAGARRRTLEERRIRRARAAQAREIRARREAERRFARDWLRQRHAPEAKALRDRHRNERDTLSQQQGKLLPRFFAVIDFTGRTRRKNEAMRLALAARHKAEREALAGRIREARTVQRAAVEARYRPEIDELARLRAQQLDILRERHTAEQAQEDRLLQEREAEREQGREALQQQIDAWKRAQRERDREGGSTAAPPARSPAGHAFDQAQDRTPETQEPRAETEAEKRARLRREMEDELRRSRERQRDRGPERD